MKKLIATLSTFVSVFSTASIVVSYGSAKSSPSGSNSKGINKDLLKTVLSDDGIDWSTLKTNSTGADVLSLIKQAITNIESTATNIKFENANEKSIVLCEGDNHFTVSFDLKGENLIFPVIVKNIQKFKPESEIYIQSFNTVLSEDGIDGSVLNTKNTGAEALYLIKKAITNIEPTAANIKFLNSNEDTKFLSKGDNNLEVSFEFKNENITCQVIVNDVQESNDLNKNEAEFYLNEIFNDKYILVNAYESMEHDPDDYEKWRKAITQKIIENQTEAMKNVVIKVVIYSPNQNIKSITFFVGNLPYGIAKHKYTLLYIPNEITKKPQHSTYQNMIKEILIKGIDASNLNKEYTYETTLPFLNAIARRFNSKVTVELKNKNQAKTLLKTGDNSIELLVNLQGYQPIQFTTLLKGVKPYVELEEVKNRYAKGRNFKKVNSSDTYESVISTYQKWINYSFPNKGIKISLKDSSKLNQKLPESTIPIKVNYSQNGKTVSGIIKPTKKYLPFQAPGDGSCLFWSAATAYLLPVRNNAEQIKVRFQELFGNDQLAELPHVQNLLEEFILENTEANQSFFEDDIVKKLVTKIFRNKVVDYIALVLSRNHSGEADVLKPGILNDNNSGANEDNDENSNNEYIKTYLENMRKESKWGGNVELTAICFMLKCNIIIVRNNDLTETKIELLNQKPNNNIKLHHIFENHYNYYLPDEID